MDWARLTAPTALRRVPSERAAAGTGADASMSAGGVQVANRARVSASTAFGSFRYRSYNSSTYARLTPVIPCQFVIPLQSYLPCVTRRAPGFAAREGGRTMVAGSSRAGPLTRGRAGASGAVALCSARFAGAVLFDVSDEIFAP